MEVAAAAPVELPVTNRLESFTRIAQTWNNCGPATLTMLLNFWGWGGSQKTAAATLKPDAEDKNVSPDQMVAFVNDEIAGLQAVVRYGGTLELLKRLLVAGFPVIIETGFEPDGEEWMGHYRLLVGYSDLEASFYVYDSFLGDGENHQGRVEDYESIDTFWQHFNRIYLVIYRPDQEAQLADILGESWDVEANARRALQTAQREAQMDPGNPFAWFNLGTSFVLLGDYEKAATAYDQARYIGLPWRMLWYQFGPYEAYLNTDPPRLEDVEALAKASLSTTQYVEETYYYLGMVHMMRGEDEEAASQFHTALRHNRNFTPAATALAQVE